MNANLFALVLLAVGSCAVAAAIVRVLKSESDRVGKFSDTARHGT